MGEQKKTLPETNQTNQDRRQRNDCKKGKKNFFPLPGPLPHCSSRQKKGGMGNVTCKSKEKVGKWSEEGRRPLFFFAHPLIIQEASRPQQEKKKLRRSKEKKWWEPNFALHLLSHIPFHLPANIGITTYRRIGDDTSGIVSDLGCSKVAF